MGYVFLTVIIVVLVFYYLASSIIGVVLWVQLNRIFLNIQSIGKSLCIVSRNSQRGSFIRNSIGVNYEQRWKILSCYRIYGWHIHCSHNLSSNLNSINHWAGHSCPVLIFWWFNTLSPSLYMSILAILTIIYDLISDDKRRRRWGVYVNGNGNVNGNVV